MTTDWRTGGPPRAWVTEWPLIALAALVGSAAAGFWVTRPKPAESAAVSSPREVVEFLGERPIRIEETPIVSLPITRDELAPKARVVGIPAAGQRRSLSRMLHAAQIADLIGPEATAWFERDRADRIVGLSLPPEIFRPSWKGLLVRREGDGSASEGEPAAPFLREEHRDQLIANLAELGVPLLCKIITPAGPARVRDLLEGSIAEFHLAQKELAWTAAAYALYLPPQPEWVNRFGERYDFDQLAEALMARSLADESCGGTHLVWATLILLHADAFSPVLGPAVRARLRSHLATRIQEAIASQLSDGSWPPRWSATGFHGRNGKWFSTRADADQRLLVSTHLLAMFHTLPRDLRPPEGTVRRGLVWARERLETMSPESLAAQFCPCTHTLRVLSLASPPRR